LSLVLLTVTVAAPNGRGGNEQNRCNKTGNARFSLRGNRCRSIRTRQCFSKASQKFLDEQEITLDLEKLSIS